MCNNEEENVVSQLVYCQYSHFISNNLIKGLIVTPCSVSPVFRVSYVSSVSSLS